jgi:hypothetical protein
MIGRQLFLLLTIVPTLAAQAITGSITGTVQDPSGLPILGAEIKLVQQGTGALRQTVSGDRGTFVIGSLQPGEYDLSVKAQGFKQYEVRGVILSASEIRAVPEIVLEIGTTTDRVTVEDRAAVVQTASGERGGVLTTNQVDSLQIKNRTVMSMLQLLPGVVDNNPNNEAPSRNWYLYVQGTRQNANNVSADGYTINAIGNNFNSIVGVGMDAIQEVKVLMSNLQAEYGRVAGANVQLITKSGTHDFHGLGSYFVRNEAFNANDFFANRAGLPRSLYRYNTISGNIGGPVFIPGKFNRNRDKLFFFFSAEYWPITVPRPPGTVTVPTALERAGDFSQSVDLNGKLIPVIDPTTGQQFPGNKVPASRIDPNGQALLKVFPLPNYANRAISGGTYNYVFQTANDSPLRSETIKFDYNANPKNRLFVNFTGTVDTNSGALGIPDSGSTNWPQMTKTYSTSGRLLVGRYTRVFSPTLINELNVGGSTRPAQDTYSDAEVARNQRTTAGYQLGQFSPSINPLGLIPNATFGGVTNAANLMIEGRFPLLATQKSTNITDNLTKVLGVHTLKAGMYLDRFWNTATPQVNFTGLFDFGRNVNNPFDTGYAYGNAIAGVFNSYTEPNGRPHNISSQGNIEWFVQDNWKVTRRLTVDVGVRFYYLAPVTDRGNNYAGFVPAAFDPKQQVKLISPATVGGKRVGIDPSGKAYPATSIGAIVPGIGDPGNGVASDQEQTLIKNRGVLYAPRFGFAYDPKGDGKTAVRGGFGVFYARNGSPLVPYTQNPVIQFGTLPTLLSTAGLVSPQNVVGIEPSGLSSSVMNFSLSVQRNIGWGTVVDAGYVSSLGRHLEWTQNLNSIPFGANFDPRNADPTISKTPLSSNFLRPYVGYGNITFTEPAGTSNYNSLQVSVNRRYGHGLQLGASWTWSKAMDFNDDDASAVSRLVPVRVWNYGLAAFDRTHVLKVNWLWDIPKTSFKNPVLKMAFNDWMLNGITSFSSGAPLGIGYSTTAATDITGSPTDGARVVVLSNPVLPKSDRTFSRNFRTDAFALPAPGTIGNAPKTSIRGPGINNWDLSLFKNIPIHEAIRFQLRWEAYNAFNHTQFSSLDTTARFDPTGKQVNPTFGAFTASRTARVMQLALRLYF